MIDLPQIILQQCQVPEVKPSLVRCKSVPCGLISCVVVLQCFACVSCDVGGCVIFSQESEGDSDDMWDRSSESESSTSDEEGRPIGTLTADFFRKK